MEVHGIQRESMIKVQAEKKKVEKRMLKQTGASKTGFYPGERSLNFIIQAKGSDWRCLSVGLIN